MTRTVRPTYDTTTYRRARHSVSLLHAHLVFVTKYRRPVFTDAMLTLAEQTMRGMCGKCGMCGELDVVLVEFNGKADYLHLLVGYAPTLAISTLVQQLKGSQPADWVALRLTGGALANSLRSQAPNMSIGSYGVNYPADVSAAKGANDMSAHVQSMATSCSNTRMVLGGYSLGAAAANLMAAMTQPGFSLTNPLPASMDQHIAAVALFGNGTRRVLGPVPNFSPAFAGKTIDQCADGDPICAKGGMHWHSHLQPSYTDSGLVNQRAEPLKDASVDRG